MGKYHWLVAFLLHLLGLSSASLEIKDAGNGLNGMLNAMLVLVPTHDF